MSFSKQVKREIIAAELPQKCCARAAAYAAACFSASYGPGGLCLTTEMSAVAQYLKKVFARAGIQGRVYAKGAEQSRMYEFTVAESQQVKRMLEMFFFNTGSPCLRLKKELFCCEKCVSAFATSAFYAAAPSQTHRRNIIWNFYRRVISCWMIFQLCLRRAVLCRALFCAKVPVCSISRRASK